MVVKSTLAFKNRDGHRYEVDFGAGEPIVVNYNHNLNEIAVPFAVGGSLFIAWAMDKTRFSVIFFGKPRSISEIFRKTAKYDQRHKSQCRGTEEHIEVHMATSYRNSEYKIQRAIGYVSYAGISVSVGFVCQHEQTGGGFRSIHSVDIHTLCRHGRV